MHYPPHLILQPSKPENATLKPAKRRKLAGITVDSVKHWKGGAASKPGLSELRAEVIRRTPDARPGAWPQDKLVRHLLTTDPPGGPLRHCMACVPLVQMRNGHTGTRQSRAWHSSLAHTPIRAAGASANPNNTGIFVPSGSQSAPSPNSEVGVSMSL